MVVAITARLCGASGRRARALEWMSVASSKKYASNFDRGTNGTRALSSRLTYRIDRGHLAGVLKKVASPHRHCNSHTFSHP